MINWTELLHSNIDLPEEWRPYIVDPISMSHYSSAVMQKESARFAESMQKLLIYGTLETEEDKERHKIRLAEWEAQWEEIEGR